MLAMTDKLFRGQVTEVMEINMTKPVVTTLIIAPPLYD